MPREKLTEEERARRRAEGQRRKERREELGLTQADVAEYVRRRRDGISIAPQMIGEMERGERPIPTDEPEEFPARGLGELRLPSVAEAWDLLLSSPAEQDLLRQELDDRAAVDRAAKDPEWTGQESAWEAEERSFGWSLRRRARRVRHRRGLRG